MQKAVYAIPIAAVLVAVAFFIVPHQQAEAVANYTIAVNGQARKTFIVYLQKPEDDSNYPYSVADTVVPHKQANRVSVTTSTNKPDLDIKYGLLAGSFYEYNRDYITTYNRFESDVVTKTTPGPANNQITSITFLGTEYETVYLWIKSDSGTGLQQFNLQTEANKYLYNGNAAKTVTLEQSTNGNYLVTIKDTAGAVVSYVSFHPDAVVSIKASGKHG